MRTRLRRLRTDDFANMRVLESDPEIMRFTSARVPQTEDQSRERLERSRNDAGVWAGELNDGTFVGWFMLKPQSSGEFELGFMIVPQLHGQGLTTEIAGKLVALAREQDPSAQIMARTTPDNHASMRVLEKLGFVCESQGELNFFRLK